ncbi:MAG: hypothetical protein ACMG6S_26235 [Byssovorax sp.]
MLTLLLVTLVGCVDTWDTTVDVFRCDNPDKGHKDANGDPDPCHRNDPDAGDAGDGDAGDAGDADPPDAVSTTCDGQCVPAVPNQWFGPALVWMGVEVEAPPCPAVAPVESYTGHGDLGSVASFCGACACAPPSGSCELPATLTASASVCPGDGSGVTHTSFDPPANWGGTCTAASSTPAGKLCGGVPCVQSITIAPLTLKQDGCSPIEPTTMATPPAWGTFARSCITAPSTRVCGVVGELCAPMAPEPAFKLCISRSGDPEKPALACPSNYPVRSVFYDELLDDRTCSPCLCDAPTGSTCTGSISIFDDSACSAPLISTKIGAAGPLCHDVPAGSALGSKSASEPIYSPGTCAPTGGVQNGSAVPDGATVFCCREPLEGVVGSGP